MTDSKQRIAIIGAGIGGMSAAYDLAKAGKDVVIYEGSDHVGGLAAGFKEPHWDWTVERFYHHWFHSDEHMLGLIDELGWSDQVLFPRPVTVMYHEGKFYPFDSITAALMYPGLGWGVNKIRFGLVGLYLRLTKNWRALEKTTVDRWMRKWAGDRVYESMWEPMMIGKFGEEYAKVVNMAWMWARLHARTTRLGTFEGGFQTFADKFAERLKTMGVEIKLNARVNGITQAGEGQVSLLPEGAETQTYDQVLATTSPGLLARLAPDLAQPYLQGLLNLKSMGAVVMVVSLKHQLSTQGYYWYNIPKQAGFPFLSLVEHTNFLSPEYFGGERGRLALAKLSLSEANLLLLDEPTNDLDVNTLRSLEQALEEFAGCAVVVSHDRWFLDRIATHILPLGHDEKPRLYLGNWSDYEEGQLNRGKNVGVSRKDARRELKRD